jgi:hypothetical protein
MMKLFSRNRPPIQPPEASDYLNRMVPEVRASLTPINTKRSAEFFSWRYPGHLLKSLICVLILISSLVGFLLFYLLVKTAADRPANSPSVVSLRW